MPDLYAVLGVNRAANPNEIKSAYRRLARKYHPDVSTEPSAASKFAQINEAYHTLIDPERRKSYDRTGQTQSSTVRQANVAAARAARRAYYQARADQVVNEWLERERQEARARGKAVYTTVTLFVSTFFVSMRPSFFEPRSITWKITVFALFAVGAWHLFKSLKEHFDYYTYRPERISITRRRKTDKRFKRSVAWMFVISGYLLSLITGMLIGMLMDSSWQLIGNAVMTDSFFVVLLYPPIAVLIVDTMYKINMHFENL
ncbi:MAG TPA: DnaJ domain-containing protein [Blastocatellia bacterium]|jgi:curved DNA-binding protein CbpA